MRINKILQNIFSKETFINGAKATYQDMVWLFMNVQLGKDFLKMVKVIKNKMFVYTI
jgi:hypothetical protein